MKDLDRSNISIHIIEHFNIHPGEEAIVRELLQTKQGEESIVRELLHRIPLKQETTIKLNVS